MSTDHNQLNRRQLLKLAAFSAGAAGLGVLSASSAPARAAQPAPSITTVGPEPLFSISLAQWSFNRAIFSGKMTNLDFPAKAKNDCGISIIEYVNQFFKDKAKHTAYLTDLKRRCDDLGVRSGLIMCDGEGDLGDPDDAKRTQAVENHYKWVEAAKFLGCHSIRVNAGSRGSYDEQMALAADGLSRLTKFGADHDMNIIVENHGGLSSNGEWLAGVMRKVNHPRCGTLPDFGNFTGSDGQQYDRYEGTRAMMPFAKGVSAKSYGFDDKGEETTIDYRRMLKIVIAAGYRGAIGVEYEGDKHSEDDGVRLTKQLLERLRAEMKGE